MKQAKRQDTERGGTGTRDGGCWPLLRPRPDRWVDNKRRAFCCTAYNHQNAATNLPPAQKPPAPHPHTHTAIGLLPPAPKLTLPRRSRDHRNAAVSEAVLDKQAAAHSCKGKNGASMRRGDAAKGNTLHSVCVGEGQEDLTAGVASTVRSQSISRILWCLGCWTSSGQGGACRTAVHINLPRRHRHDVQVAVAAGGSPATDSGNHSSVKPRARLTARSPR